MSVGQNITAITPTIPGREALLAECEASVKAAGIRHRIAVDHDREGPAVIRNRLVQTVTTDWVVFVDDDDLLFEGYAEIVGRHFYRADLIYTGWELEGATQPTPCALDPWIELVTNLIPVTVCLRTAVFRELDGFDVDAPVEDHDLWRRLMLAWDEAEIRPAYRIVYEPTVAWRYRRLAGSRTEELV